LSDTDPLEGRFLTRDEILLRIEETLPSARSFIRGVLDARLERLRDKANAEGRQVRYYKAGDKYCLPFDTRLIVQQENVDDEGIRAAVSDAFSRRFDAIAEEDEALLLDEVVEVCHQTLEKLFERQGLHVAQFMTDDDQDTDLVQNVADIIGAVLDSRPNIPDSSKVGRLAGRVLRGTFYDSTDEEREYLQKLSRTYVLLLILKNEPRVVEYFKSISSKFVLYVGTDFLVRALSEHYLKEENQITQNLFRILKAAGATLVLTEKAVDELATHIRSQIFEFEHVYAHTEHRMTRELVEYVSRILIRSYFYARLSPIDGIKAPPGWRSYVEQFGSYNAIRAHRGNEDLARYLVAKFGMIYESEQEMLDGIDMNDVNELASEIVRVRQEGGKLRENEDVLAYNDALQVFRVYARRRRDGETSPANPYGFRTWWLTQDVKVRRASGQVIGRNHGQRFMMRPEFLLNFISMAPSTAEVSRSFERIFPTVLGVKLSNRVPAKAFRRVMEAANEIWAVDEARAGAMITEFTNTLKGDNVKVYENEWS
jgi:hypothetical protein